MSSLGTLGMESAKTYPHICFIALVVPPSREPLSFCLYFVIKSCLGGAKFCSTFTHTHLHLVIRTHTLAHSHSRTLRVRIDQNFQNFSPTFVFFLLLLLRLSFLTHFLKNSVRCYLRVTRLGVENSTLA